MRVPSLISSLVLVSALAVPGAARAAEADQDPRISVDFKDADIADVVRLFAEVGGFQVVMDPGTSCKLTLKLNQVHLETALDVALRSCGLGRDEEGGILRIARTAKLAAEAAEARKLAEAQELARPRTMRSFRPAYAKAAELAPLVKKMLSPRGEVIVDARTNTLIVID